MQLRVRHRLRAENGMATRLRDAVDRPWRGRGASLIEVMIALVVVSIGMLGIAAAQMKSLQSSRSSYAASIAAVRAADFGERLWGVLCAFKEKDQAARLVIAGRIRDQWLVDHGFIGANEQGENATGHACHQPICFISTAGLANGEWVYEAPGASHPHYAYRVDWDEETPINDGDLDSTGMVVHLSLPSDALTRLICP